MRIALARLGFAVVMLSIGLTRVIAQNQAIPSGASIFSEEMDNDLDGYLRAEFVKKQVPLSVVLIREEAHLVLTGASTAEAKRKWHEGWRSRRPKLVVGGVWHVGDSAKSRTV